MKERSIVRGFRVKRHVGRHAAFTGILLLCIYSIAIPASLAQGTFRASPSPRLPALPKVVDRTDIKTKHKVIAAEVIALLPERCRSRIRNFYVHYDGTLKSRGYAGKDTVIMRGDLPDSEFRGVLVHEVIGHFNDLGCIAGTPSSGASAFRDGTDIIYKDDPSVLFYTIDWSGETVRQKGSVKTNFISGYSLHDAFEDQAEFLTAYVLNPRYVRTRAARNEAIARKLAWVETYVFPGGLTAARGLYQERGKELPWDATKMPYVWEGQNLVAANR